jgi:hypothetical protein
VLGCRRFPCLALFAGVRFYISLISRAFSHLPTDVRTIWWSTCGFAVLKRWLPINFKPWRDCRNTDNQLLTMQYFISLIHQMDECSDDQRVVLLFSKDDWLIFYAPVIRRNYIFMPFRVCLNLFIIKHKQYVHKFNKSIVCNSQTNVLTLQFYFEMTAWKYSSGELQERKISANHLLRTTKQHVDY